MKPTRFMLAAVACCVLAFCGCSQKKETGPKATDEGQRITEKAGPNSVPVEQGTPKQALNTWRRAIAQADPVALEKVIHPDFAKAVKVMAACYAELADKQNQLAKAAEDNYGPDIANQVRAQFRTPGSVNWARVSIEGPDDKPEVKSDGQPVQVSAVKLDDKWFVVLQAEQAAGDEAAKVQAIRDAEAKAADRFETKVKPILARMTELIAKVQAKALTKEQFEIAWHAMQAGPAAQAAPPAEGT